jgi:hypothetical protein
LGGKSNVDQSIIAQHQDLEVYPILLMLLEILFNGSPKVYKEQAD